MVSLVAGCSQAELRRIDPSAEGVFELELSATSIDFGRVAVGDRGEASLQATNVGTVEAVIGRLGLPPEAGWTATIDDPLLAPGDATRIRLTWDPDRPGFIEQQLGVWVGPDARGLDRRPVGVTGSALGAQLTLSVAEHDLGDVPLGCRTNLRITASNSGNEPLTVDAVDLLGDTAFHLTEASPLPWVIPPFSSQEFAVEYDPATTAGDEVMVVVRSDVGERRTRVSGRGVADQEVTQQVKVFQKGGVRFVVLVNWIVINPTYGWDEEFWDGIPVFFQALKDTGHDYRVAFVYEKPGFHTEVEYIDDTYSVAQAVEKVEDDLAPILSWYDNDAYGASLVEAVQANRSWLFETESWASSSLSLVAITADDEKSLVAPATYIADAQSEFKAVTFSAIGGTPAPICTPADDLRSYRTAITATGGLFLDVCATDWTDHMRKLVAAASPGAREGSDSVVTLRGTPLASSLVLTLDGERLYGGWSYDPSLNAVIVDSEFALAGSVVEISYRTSEVCGG